MGKLFLDNQRRCAPHREALQYPVDAWSGRSKPLFRLPVLKIHLIYSPRVEDVSDIKLIRTDTTLDLSQKAEKRYPTTVRTLRSRVLAQASLPRGGGAGQKKIEEPQEPEHSQKPEETAQAKDRGNSTGKRNLRT